MTLHVKPKKQWHKIVLLILFGALALTCIYSIVLATTPFFILQVEKLKTGLTPAHIAAAVSDSNTIYIPKIHVTSEFKTGDTSALNNGAWHRHPERGNPETGGNFILSAHRFELAPTPAEVHRKSPFFAIDQLQPGDEITVDFNKKRYHYKIISRSQVKPHQTSIEAPSSEAKLTLYTCTLGGEFDGREVIKAKLAS